jgi:hypothetical protein
MKLNRMIAGGVFVIALGAFALPVFAAEAEAKAEERTSEPYPLTTCAISGEDLLVTGEPVTVLHEGRELKFCCADCAGQLKTDPEAAIKKIDAAIVKQQMPFYPLKTCVVGGEELGSMGKPVDLVLDNRLVRLCCANCVDELNKNKEQYIEKLNAAVIEAQDAKYPLETCPISGSKLGSMGEPVKLVYANQLVKLCCAGCKPKLESTLGYRLQELRKAAGMEEAPAGEAKAVTPGMEHDHGAH